MHCGFMLRNDILESRRWEEAGGKFERRGVHRRRRRKGGGMRRMRPGCCYEHGQRLAHSCERILIATKQRVAAGVTLLMRLRLMRWLRGANQRRARRRTQLERSISQPVLRYSSAACICNALFKCNRRRVVQCVRTDLSEERHERRGEERRARRGEERQGEGEE